jgi:hypothetical protein
LSTALDKLGLKLTKDNIQAMIAAVDDNGDGVIDREEVSTFHKTMYFTANPKHLNFLYRNNQTVPRNG